MSGKKSISQHTAVWLLPSLIWISLLGVLAALFSENLINSDMSAELILARELVSERKLLSNSWFYSTELRLLNTQLIAVPLFMIFDSFKIVRVLQIIILNTCMLWAYCFA